MNPLAYANGSLGRASRRRTLRACLTPSLAVLGATLSLLTASTSSALGAETVVANPKPDAAKLRVMSFNIRYGTASDGENSWSFRRDLVVRTIRGCDPDLLGVQEALAFQCEFLRQQLPAYAFHGAGRDDGKEGGEFCGIYYRRDRFELVDAGHFWLSETPSIPGSVSWDSSLTRMLSWVVLRDRREGGREFIYANTHFDHRGRQARLESARLIRQRAGELLPEIPVILTGDFNTTEDGEPYAALVQGADADRTRLTDAYRAVHPERLAEEASFNSWKLTLEGNRIDWVLHSDHFLPESAAINRSNDGGRMPSDHYPVEALLRWR